MADKLACSEIVARSKHTIFGMTASNACSSSSESRGMLHEAMVRERRDEETCERKD